MSPGEFEPSGVFVRIEDLSDPVFTGLEVQVYSPPGIGLHDFGAIYDLVHHRDDCHSTNLDSGTTCWFVALVP